MERDWVTLMRKALKEDDHPQMRHLLEQMRRSNVGEAYYPGLKVLCAQARVALAT